MFASRNFLARSNRFFWISRNRASICRAAPSSGTPIVLPSLPGMSRRAHEAVVVRVRHDQPADEARRGPPARRPGVLPFPLLGRELDVERLREVLPQEVARPGLEGLAVLHQGLDAEGVDGPRELLP